MQNVARTLRRGAKLGKYRIEKRLAEGGFATVFKAIDTVEGIPVALKVPQQEFLTKEALEDFRKEVRVTAWLDHPNILNVKDANFIDGRFVIVTLLGECTLADRLTRRLSTRAALDYSSQFLAGLAHAHEHRIIHCDIKPENLILFRGGRLRLTDFGIARFALRTLRGSGSGTVGYIAPEQAMGLPSFRADVFAAGLVLYRTLAGALPEWPFEWPPPGYDRLRQRVSPELIKLLGRCLSLDPRRRPADAVQLLAAFQRLRPRALVSARGSRRRNNAPRQNKTKRHWKEIRLQHFLKDHGRQLQVHGHCRRCRGPVGESMQACPWCGTRVTRYDGETRHSLVCPRCNRGMKLDWRYCPWCYGAGYEPHTRRRLADQRYTARCGNSSCDRKVLMPFMRYCPWCRRKVTRKWKLDGTAESCSRCGWDVLAENWDHCPWCAKALKK